MVTREKQKLMMATRGSVVPSDIESIVCYSGVTFEPLSGTTLLVTGANGFLCSYFVDVVAALNESILSEPCRVIAVDNSPAPFTARFAHLAPHNEIRFVQDDVTRPLALEERIDWIVHGASIASPSFYRRFPLETIDVNVIGTRLMLDLAEQNRSLGVLYLSTSEIYGDPDPAHIPTPEEYRGHVSCMGPRACYDESKRLGETLCVTYHQLFGTPVKVVRPFNVYGPAQSLDDRRIIPDLMRSAVSREPIVLFSDGNPSRAFCYVTDAISAMFHILLSGSSGEAFNVGNDKTETSISALAQMVREIAGPPQLRMEYKASNDPQYLADNPQRRCPDLTKLRGRFQWQPIVPLTDGLSRTFHSYMDPACHE